MSDTLPIVRDIKAGDDLHLWCFIGSVPVTVQHVTTFDALIEHSNGKAERVPLRRLCKTAWDGSWPWDGGWSS